MRNARKIGKFFFCIVFFCYFCFCVRYVIYDILIYTLFGDVGVNVFDY